MNITKDSVVGNVLDAHPDCAQYFFEIGMHCLGCPCSRSETIDQACAAHGADADALLTKLKAAAGK